MNAQEFKYTGSIQLIFNLALSLDPPWSKTSSNAKNRDPEARLTALDLHRKTRWSCEKEYERARISRLNHRKGMRITQKPSKDMVVSFWEQESMTSQNGSPLYRLLPVIYSCLGASFTRFRLHSCHDKCSTRDVPFLTSEIQVTYCCGGIAVTGGAGTS